MNILIALVLFEQHGVEWAAVETAVGGRYDQTTALEAHLKFMLFQGVLAVIEDGHASWYLVS